MQVRKGFTLVELLIVIVIIGILASAMMLSSGSATAAAEASTIVSDLRSMKAASLMLYADSMDYFNVSPVPPLSTTYLKPYVDNPDKYNSGGNYKFTKDASYKWWVGYNLIGRTPEVKNKLEGKAKSIGLFGAVGNLSSTNAYKATNASVWMVAR
ncbi:MAG: prepilin-type N-terminal cleavage/methylation domain-containing protein [Synergistaceae bacterium]|nr:prepilin-type N-terminal cleavage/methylation domain-containing protein [Synergistaceae bacterium]